MNRNISFGGMLLRGADHYFSHDKVVDDTELAEYIGVK